MTKALLVGDVHLSDKAPINRQATYKDDILDKLRFCVTLANELNVPIVQAGDMFHLKRPDRNSHRLVQETHEVLKETKNGVWIVPGNHDMSHDRLDSLDSQPLGALSRMSGMRFLLGYDSDLPNICGIPYLTEFDSSEPSPDEFVPTWGLAIQEFWEQYGTEPDGSCYNDLTVTHAPLFPPGKAPDVYNSIDPQEWRDFFSHDGPINTYYGHIHDLHGTYTVDEHQFCNQGALSRGSLHESSVNRIPAVTLWDGVGFDRIEVPHKSADEVFLFEQAAKVAENKISVVEFTKAVGTANLTYVTTDDILHYVKAAGTRKEVVSLIETILEG